MTEHLKPYETPQPDTAVETILQELGIQFRRYDHPAASTIEELAEIDSKIPATRCKNLFLRDAQKGTRQYLVIADKDTDIDLKTLAVNLGETKLSFGSSDRLKRLLGLNPGSVSPFGLIYDTANQVMVIVDQTLLQKQELSFHPNINTATLVINIPDFQKFLGWSGNPVHYMRL